MLGFLLRFCGTVLLAMGLVVALADATRSLAAASLVVTTTQQLIAGLAMPEPAPVQAPGVLALIGPLGSLVRMLPAGLVLAGLGGLLMLVGRIRPKGIGYVGR